MSKSCARALAALLCTLVLGLLLPASSIAQDDDEETDYSREGPYLGIAGIALFENAKSSLNVSHSGGLGATVGFRMVPELAIELYGDWVHLGGRNPWSIAVNAKLYVLEIFDIALLENRLQPFLIGSAGIMTGELGQDNGPGGNFRIGGGLDYWLSENLAITSHLQYSGSGGEASKLRSTNLTLGATWRY